jgi:hypothetical protein
LFALNLYVSSAVTAVPKPALASVSSALTVVPSDTTILSDVVKKKQQRKNPGIIGTIKGSRSNKVNIIAPLRQKPDLPNVYAIHPNIRPSAFKDPKDNTAKKFEPFLAKNYQVTGISIQELCQLFHFVSL